MSISEVIADGLSTDGRGVAHVDGKAIFLDRVLPGDRILLEMDEQNSRTRITSQKLLAPSPLRLAHPCPHSETCSGSLWGGLSYDEQLAQKKQLVERTLHKMIGDVDVLPPIASPKVWNYRNRITLNLWKDLEGLKAGFIPESRLRFGVAIRTCALCHRDVNDTLSRLPECLAETAFPHINRVRRLQLHHTSQGAGGLLSVGGEATESDVNYWSDLLQPVLPGGVWIASGTAAGIPRIDREPLHGDSALPMLTEWLGLPVVLPPNSFCQANAPAANLVMQRLKQWIETQPPQTVWDLYGGYGALGLACSQTDTPVNVFDLSPASNQVLDDLAFRTGHTNARYIAGDLITTFPRLAKTILPEDLIILDPPRSGAHPRLLKILSDAPVRRVAYLSCNPAKLGRDLAALLPSGFRLTEVQPYDFFPQTHSIEVLALLER